MAPPAHLQAVTAVSQCLFLTVGLRDILATGTPLPLPDEDKLMKVWTASMDKKSTAPFRSDGARDFVAQVWGTFIVALALCKLCTVFTHTVEGTYLRRNLFLVFGVCDLLTAFLLLQHDAFFMASFEVSVKPFIAIMAIEGLVLLQDALMRDRKPKKIN